MTLNWDTIESHNFIDQEHNMMLCQSSDNGIEDSIGRTLDAFFCYGDIRFIEGIQNCWKKIIKSIKLFNLIPIRKYYWQGYRYPTHYDRTLSRDHTIYSVIAFKLSGYSNKNLKRFVKHLRWRISDRYTFTPDSWLSIRSIAGIKWAEALFYLIVIPMMWGAMKHNKRIYKKAGFSNEVPQDQFKITLNEDKSEEFKKYTRKLYPVYALTNLSMQLYVMRDSWGKKWLQKILRKMVLKHNYVQKMLLRDLNFKPTSENQNLIYAYKSMKGGRWTTSLNEVNDRSLYIIKDEKLVEYNALDVDIVRKLFELHKQHFNENEAKGMRIIPWFFQTHSWRPLILN